MLWSTIKALDEKRSERKQLDRCLILQHIKPIWRHKATQNFTNPWYDQDDLTICILLRFNLHLLISTWKITANQHCVSREILAVIFHFWTLLMSNDVVIPHLRFVIVKRSNRARRRFERLMLSFANHGSNRLCWGDTDLHQWMLLPSNS